LNKDVSMPPGINKRPDASERALALLKALADEDRLRIIGLLALRPRDPLDLSMLLGVTEAALGRHIRILRRAGLVVTEGGRLRIETGPIHAVMAQTAERRPASAMVPASATQEQRRVLGTFFEGRRLVAIPVQRKKFRIILQRLAEEFQTGREYPEREVNQILGDHHQDFAALRRGLVDEGLLSRTRGFYRRHPS
jgi:hypothetical protein